MFTLSTEGEEGKKAKREKSEKVYCRTRYHLNYSLFSLFFSQFTLLFPFLLLTRTFSNFIYMCVLGSISWSLAISSCLTACPIKEVYFYSLSLCQSLCLFSSLLSPFSLFLLVDSFSLFYFTHSLCFVSIRLVHSFLFFSYSFSLCNTYNVYFK